MSTRNETMTDKETEVILRRNLNSKNVFSIFKRFSDVFLTLLFSPLIVLIVIVFAIIVKIDSEGPAFYSQMRVGLDGNNFRIYKLRSMKVNAETSTGAVWAEKDDPRVTKVGRFIRKTRIDELPQFLNVLLGDMSIVGPRPERPDLTEEFVKTIPDFKLRLLVRPGITGLAQVNGGYDITPADKLKFDKEYILNYSLKQDLIIMWKSVAVVLTGDGAR